jgi:hypothetical protein
MDIQMNTDPMIDGKTREEWSTEEARDRVAYKKSQSRAAYRSVAALSVLLVALAWTGQRYRGTHYFHEVLVWVLLAWFAHGMYMLGKASKS